LHSNGEHALEEVIDPSWGRLRDDDKCQVVWVSDSFFY